ncbi:MAG: hypothetical protein JWP35_2542 [Caulobacter sp.]|nr:hypothetical protein [Caulobacter sp.]
MDLYEKRIMTGVVDSLYAFELERAVEENRRGTLIGTPSEVACERAGQELGMSVGSIRDVLGRRNGWELE